MRGSASQTVDARFGIPLHQSPRQESAPADQPRTRPSRNSQATTAGQPIGKISRPENERIRLLAPLYSPEFAPQFADDMYPPPIPDDSSDIDELSRAGSMGDLPATRDVHMNQQLPLPAESRKTGSAGSVSEHKSPKSNAPRQSLVPSLGMVSLPRDVVTAMALALGAPARPARASRTNGPSKRSSSEVFASAPKTAFSGSFGESLQSYGRMCDLLFFHDYFPIPLAMVELLPAPGTVIARTEAYGIGAIGQERVLLSLFDTFNANDQMNRLINACAQQQVRQTKCRKEILNDECVSKRIIVSYVGMTAGDYFRSLLDPTIRALKGPWTANEAGLKGALDRLLSRLASIDAPHDMRVALKTVYACIAKKYGNRVISTLAHLLIGDLFGDVIRKLTEPEVVDSLTPEGARFLNSMASVLFKLSLNESFAGGSKLYHMNSWIQSRYENFEKSMENILAVDEPVMVSWNSGCTVQGSPANLYVLLCVLTEYKEDINRLCMSPEWSLPAALSVYQSSIPVLWTALEHGRRRGAMIDSSSSPPRSIRSGVSPIKEALVDREHTSTAQEALLGEMVKMVTKKNSDPQLNVPKTDSGSNRMAHLSATVTEMDLENRDLVCVPKLSQFRNLLTLNLAHNCIHQLGELPCSLRTLNCSHNQLSQLTGVEVLVNLETLNASHNLLQDFKSGLLNCSRMTSLDLSHNRQDSVVDFSHMLGLRHLYIDHNLLSAVQDVRLLALNSNLTSITLKGNPLCEEITYLKQSAAMLPQVDTIDDVDVVSAQVRPLEIGKSPFLSPYNTPFIKPSVPSPSMKVTTPLLRRCSSISEYENDNAVSPTLSPFLRPGSCWHSARIPDIERDTNSPRVSPITRQEHVADLRADSQAVRRLPSEGESKQPSWNCMDDREDDLGENGNAHDLLQKEHVDFTLTLAMDFSCAGSDGSLLRKGFIEKLKEDLAAASELQASCFRIQRISAGSIKIDAQILDDMNIMTQKDPHVKTVSRAPAEVVADLAHQVHDTSSRLRQGILTRHASSLAVRTAQNDSPAHEKMKNRAVSQRGSSPSAIPILAEITMADSCFHLADTVNTDRRHIYVSLQGTGRVVSVRSPHETPHKTQRTVGWSANASGGEESHVLSTRKSKLMELENNLMPKPRVSPTDNRRTNSTRISATNISPPRFQTSPSNKISPSTSTSSANIISPSKSNTSPLSTMSQPNKLSPSSPDINPKKRSKLLTVKKLDMVEMVIHVNATLKTMCLVFRGWKLVLIMSRIAKYQLHIVTQLSNSASQLVMITKCRYKNLVLRPVFKSWAERMCSLHSTIRHANILKAAQGYLKKEKFHTLRLNAFRQSTLRRKMVKGLQKRAHYVSQGAFNSWHEYVHVRRCMREVSRKEIKRWEILKLGVFFREWPRHVFKARRLRIFQDTTLLKCLNLLFKTWKAAVERRQKGIQEICTRWNSTRKGAAFQSWYCTMQEQQCRRQRVSKVQGRWTRMTLSRAFENWNDNVIVERECALIVLRNVRKLCDRHIQAALAYWHTFVFAGKRRNKIGEIMMQKESRCSLHAILDTWRYTVCQRGLLRQREPGFVERRLQNDMRAIMFVWHEVVHRRFQVASMLDKILLKRKNQNRGYDEKTCDRPAGATTTRLNVTNLNLKMTHQLACPVLSPRQPSFSPRQSDSGN